MMKLLRLAGAAATLSLLAACASGPKLAEMKSSMPALKADEGRVYFYRSSSMMGAAIQPAILMNGKEVGSSKPGGFFFIDAVPGPIEVSTATEVEKKLTFTLGAGETRYVKTSVGFGLMVGRVYPELVDNTVGARELEETGYIGKPLK